MASNVKFSRLPRRLFAFLGMDDDVSIILLENDFVMPDILLPRRLDVMMNNLSDPNNEVDDREYLKNALRGVKDVKIEQEVLARQEPCEDEGKISEEVDFRYQHQEHQDSVKSVALLQFESVEGHCDELNGVDEYDYLLGLRVEAVDHHGHDYESGGFQELVEVQFPIVVSVFSLRENH